MSKRVPSLLILDSKITYHSKPILQSGYAKVYSSIDPSLTTVSVPKGSIKALPFGQEHKLKVTVSNTSVQLINHSFGFHPIFYYFNDGIFICSTNIRELIQLLPNESFSLNTDSLIHYYCFGFEPSSESMFTKIRKLRAGYKLEYNGNKVSITSDKPLINYLTTSCFSLNEQEYLATLDSIFESGINTLQAKGLNGISLSGGVDSGYAAVKLAKTKTKFNAYTMCYGDAYNETDRIQLLEKELGIEVQKLVLHDEEIIRNFEEVNGLVSSPCGFNNASMNFIFQKAASNNIIQLFDGDGADRLFLGMNRYLKLQKLLSLYGKMRKIHVSGLLTYIFSLSGKSSLVKTHTLFKNWERGLPPYIERIYDVRSYNADFEDYLFKLAAEEEWQEYSNKFPTDNIFQDPFHFLGFYATSKCPEMFFHQPSELQLLHKINAVPGYWHTPLVELALNTPTSLKLAHNTTKYVLRKAAAQNITPKYWQLPKIGLQSSFQFATATPEGKSWMNTVTSKIRETPWHHDIQSILGVTPEIKRLLPLFFWYKSFSINS